jgi:hypothetical protein
VMFRQSITSSKRVSTGGMGKRYAVTFCSRYAYWYLDIEK